MSIQAPERIQADSAAVEKPIPLTVGIKLVNLAAVILPLLALLATIFWLWGWGLSWAHLGVFLGMYFLTALGVTIGYHRLFTHRSFEATKTVKAVLAILGSMAVEGPLFKWVATHRRHHQHSDAADDPHSPHLHGQGWWGMAKGLWHAHVGWLFAPDIPGLSRYVGDLQKDGLLRWISRLFPVWVAAGLILPAALGGLLTLSWSGVLLGFLWGGLARIFLVHHVTWSINSVCHVWGSRPFKIPDESRNNVIFGIIGLGEGWHNNHHAFPTSARHGLAWWQIDISYWIIRAMQWVGLASKVKLPSAEALTIRQEHQRHSQSDAAAALQD